MARSTGYQRAFRVNIQLRPVDDSDAAWLDGWLASAAASVAYDEVDHSRPGAALIDRLRLKRGLRAQIIVRDGDDVGLVVYRVGAPRRDAAIVEIVATPAALSRRGSGMSAAALVEDAVRAELLWARRLCTRRGWPVIEVTRRSIEETAATVLQLMDAWHIRKGRTAP